MFSAMVQLSAPDAVSLTNKPYFHGQRMAESTKRSAVAAGQGTTVGCACFCAPCLLQWISNSYYSTPWQIETIVLSYVINHPNQTTQMVALYGSSPIRIWFGASRKWQLLGPGLRSSFVKSYLLREPQCSLSSELAPVMYAQYTCKQCNLQVLETTWEHNWFLSPPHSSLSHPPSRPPALPPSLTLFPAWPRIARQYLYWLWTGSGSFRGATPHIIMRSIAESPETSIEKFNCLSASLLFWGFANLF